MPRGISRRWPPPISTAFLIDDEFDDDLDRHVAAIRESLADFRNLQDGSRP